MDDASLLAAYKQSLSKWELVALQIVRERLGSSFDLEKSIGFIRWKALTHPN